MSEKKEKRDQVLEERRIALEEEWKRIEEKAGGLANYRGICFVGALVLFVLFFVKKQFVFLIPACVVFLGFIILVAIHGRIKAKAQRIAVLKEIHEANMARTLHDFSKLPDDGSDLQIKKHAFSGDLDIFGPKSLFHLINIAHTAYGRRQLQKWLLLADSQSISREDILSRQEAVKELSSRLSLVEELEASTRMNVKKKGSPQALLAFIAAPVTGMKKGFLVLRISLAVLFYLSLIAGMVMGGYYLIFPSAILIFQMGMMALCYKTHAVTFDLVEKFYPELRAYSNIFTGLENVEVKASYLQGLRDQLYGKSEENCTNRSASNQLSSLYMICLLIQARMQPLLYFVLNVAMPFDEICLHLLEKWRKESGKEIPEKLQAIGEWEALMSLSLMGMIFPDGCMPEILEKDLPFFEAEEMGHPLIEEKRVVRNNFKLDRGCAMITGSNMSGKTTLLRTVGINTILAYTGAVCPAKALSLSIMRVAASMRIEDNLGEGVSTFYAELVKIERIVRASESGTPLLFLIDEIFRGTNSKDRTDGAWIVLKKLHSPKIIGMMSTHDYELCKMDTNGEVDLVFYHFSEYFDDDGLHFDYKLKAGMSSETNAKYLMKLVGIEE